MTQAQTSASAQEVLYTICPVFVASNVALELGILDEEFRRVGATPRYLRSLPDNAGWLPHFTHSLPKLFRDGGAIPTIQARADLTDTTLIAATFAQRAGQILVRTDSGIHRVADLKGRRIGLTRSLATEKIDFVRATAERGIELALAIAGLERSEVDIVILEEVEAKPAAPANRPAENWGYLHRHVAQDLLALQERRVEAIYSSPARSAPLIASGEYKVIEDLDRYPDWSLRVTNGPYTTAVNTEFAKAHPEVVVAWLRAAIRAGQWINANRRAAADIFARVTTYRDTEQIARLIQEFDFVPSLSPQNLAGLTIQKDFLRSHGYVKNDFAIEDWADSRYLEEAHASLRAEATQTGLRKAA
ncbi:ABC transporter substrate-binding protein [Uliginosibacterium aquaticum]|uniref:ABC transporter substrate-binding protein n=1 Tax=Uliginosibacterium aquaticum TaxID=2731212 RepID=A0ABX2ILR9_9RHOO|nr:ABC transporter substrate-binding protein [Uliginosibacterium aquaticum]NSL55065.1 ABC transporter substrate-binding protein [Uliginosibacterium aquaticum]